MNENMCKFTTTVEEATAGLNAASVGGGNG